MYIFLVILIGLFTILFLITLHEFAHFVIAKLSGAYVYEFAIGMGPKILQWGKKETRYTLRLLPLGGYVSVASEIADAPKGREAEVVDPKRMMENLHRGKKAIFISAGALMNLLLAFILLMVGYGIYPYKYDPNLLPTYASKGPLADAVEKYNLANTTIPILSSSEITHIWNTGDGDHSSDKNIKSYYDLQKWLNSYNKKYNDVISDYQITFFDNDKVNKLVTFKPEDQKGTLFIGVSQRSDHLSSGSVFSEGIIDAFKDSYSLLQALGQLVTFHWQNISGPVGIVKSTNIFLNPDLSATQGASTYFRWAALLSSNLFLLNMLPIPPLDGYKFVENAVEAATRKKLNTKYKTIVTIAGALLFLIIFVAITIKDIFF
ncbi:site-2 protease family protein [Spiroplasma endosymbiont of Virgichneumon dumeticola]|uniref:site-2 protease family protein n=1 Tax=Spiroplasma endosymbiont of Virgichneumon dumeticola TaxID=3139323 RepID=UPI0035C8CB93